MADGWPDRDAYKAWARVVDNFDDVAIDDALAAVLTAIESRCPVLFGATPAVPDDAHQAALIWANRLLARRNSSEGVIGTGGDLSAIRVGRWDPDVERLLAPYKDVVIA
jgi:hypothetical protein